MSLAQANFTSPNRTRYGQDHYDDRMQASKTMYTCLFVPGKAVQLTIVQKYCI